MTYSQRAGEQAQTLYAPREALTYFTQALDSAQNLGLYELVSVVLAALIFGPTAASPQRRAGQR